MKEYEIQRFNLMSFQTIGNYFLAPAFLNMSKTTDF